MKARLALLAVLAFGCGGAPPAPTPAAESTAEPAPARAALEWVRYENDTQGYSLEYPSTWTVLEARPRLDTSAVQAREVLGEELGEREIQKVTFLEKEGMMPGEFTVAVLENAPGRNLAEWTRRYKVADVSGGDLVTERSVDTVAGRPAQRFVVFQFDAHATVLFLLHRGKILVLSFVAETPNDPDLESHRAAYVHFIESLRLIDA